MTFTDRADELLSREKKAEEILGTAQVAAEFNISANTLRYWRHCGEGPASFTLGRKKVVYRRGEVERWIAEQEKSTSRGGVALAGGES